MDMSTQFNADARSVKSPGYLLKNAFNRKVRHDMPGMWLWWGVLRLSIGSPSAQAAFIGCNHYWVCFYSPSSANVPPISKKVIQIVPRHSFHQKMYICTKI